MPPVSPKGLLVSLVLAGCGAEPLAAFADDGELIDAGGLWLEVVSSRETDGEGELVAVAGTRFVVAEIELDNEDHDRPVSMAPLLFAARSTAGVDFLGSHQTAYVEGACSARAMVVVGGSHVCFVAFEVPSDQAVAALVYRPHPEVELFVPIEPEPDTRCVRATAEMSDDAVRCGE